ncbi:SAM-dependent methyltransferase [Actinomadura sp. DC4]|uniref:SAM-dependent methyltransferase n=1 Tax=Actinomadura sp. DC4 TaxID=3055069 RepID=UPI0025AFC4D3|nr:SAM-dependent methyltransferase [Actinomadura sp. DC4]MDN3355139.1 SAM-dependent methyltransferase [Actinomadura sp. DC4]
MADHPDERPSAVDLSVPNIARMNDYLLGGKDNFAADREAAEALLAIAPEVKKMAVENRGFLGRVVRYLGEQGVRQFIDVAAGLPTQRNTHEVARSQVADAHVVYVDSDPVVLSHARAILVDSPATAVLDGDILHPEHIVEECKANGWLDFDRPIAVVIFAALQFIPHSDDPFKSIACLRDALPSGSYLGLSHVVFDDRPDTIDPIEDIYRAMLDRPGEHAARTRDQVLPFFDGFELVEPGLVHIRDWRPDGPIGTRARDGIWMAGGVGRKP